jgi:hypothetical protein
VGRDLRAVTAAMKRKVFEAYGLIGDTDVACVADGHGRRCEVDHLISRELGGADVVGKPVAAAIRHAAVEHHAQGPRGEPTTCGGMRRPPQAAAGTGGHSHGLDGSLCAVLRGAVACLLRLYRPRGSPRIKSGVAALVIGLIGHSIVKPGEPEIMFSYFWRLLADR